MTRVLCFYILATASIAVRAFPSASQRVFTQHAPDHLNYYLDNQGNYYGPEQKEVNRAPARLETLEPDSEVELVPGVQPPQQPPQQQPVAPNIPGLLPGQRVFIVHMPVPGYRPGTIGGYQPVYIVAAAPQGNAGYPGSGYQNAILVDPSGQPVSPVLGYQKAAAAPQHNPGFVLGGPLALTRPLELGYQDYANPAPILQPVDGIRGIQLAQIALQPVHQGQRVPVGPVQQANAGPTPNHAGESEALLAPKTSQAIKEDPSPAKLRSGAIPRKLTAATN